MKTPAPAGSSLTVSCITSTFITSAHIHRHTPRSPVMTDCKGRCEAELHGQAPPGGCAVLTRLFSRLSLCPCCL